MKKLILSAAFFVAIVGASTAQTKEGSITYNVTMEGLPPEQAAMMDGTEQKTYFKNEKVRIEFSNAFVNTISINDGKKTTVLMDQMGQKFYMEMTDEDMKKNEAKSAEAKIEYKDETKKVAGYDCKKAVIKSKNEKGEENTTTVWYTEQLPNSGQGASKGSNAFKNLKGAALEYEASQAGFKMKFSATNVSTTAVADSKFVVNTEGYVKKSQDDLKKMGGGK